MKVIVDTNIILSALIKDSYTRKVIIKSGLNEEEYKKVLNLMLKCICVIPDEIILKNIDIAKNIMQKHDPDDVVFISAGISIDNSVIWSDDKHFDLQERLKVYKSNHIINIYKSIFEKNC